MIVSIENFLQRVDRSGPGGCWLWLGARQGHGYGCLYDSARRDEKSRGMRLAHRTSWALFKGEEPGALDVLHRCDNPPCVNPDHLFLGTAKDNGEDMVAKGRDGHTTKPDSTPKGSRHGCAVLTEDQVREIRAGKASLKALAVRFGVSKSTVSFARRGLTWKCLDGESVPLSKVPPCPTCGRS